MPKPKNFGDEFYAEAMVEMAGNFFSRRKEMEHRLDGLAALTREVRQVAASTLAHWRTFFSLAVDQALAETFLRAAGMDPAGLADLARQADDPWRFKPPFALTAAGRYRKSLAWAYNAAREATSEYRHGSYGPDPRDPRRKVLRPNFESLRTLAETINEEVRKVNADQSPSQVLAYINSLDAAGTERANITGGLAGEDVVKIDRDMAFKPVDFASLNLPDLAVPQPLDDIQPDLDRLADAILATHRSQALEALAAVSA